MNIVQNVRYALRMWRRYPLLTTAAIVSLALGMGANTAVFSVLNALLLTTPPVTDPGTLVAVYSTTTANPDLHGMSFQNFMDLRRALPFELTAIAPVPVGLSTADGQPEQVPAELVSSNYFDLLGVRATKGRTLADIDDSIPAASPVVVISDRLWVRRFGGRSDIVGQAVSINTQPFTIVGVAAPGFSSLDVLRSVDLWIPLSMHQAALTGVQSFYFRQRSAGLFDIVARVAPPLTSLHAQTLLQAQALNLATTFPDDNKGLSVSVRPLREAQMKPAQRDVWLRAGSLLAVVVGLVLAIACANVANLLLARSTARRREISIRVALGASRRNLMAQLLVESAMLSGAGGLLGLFVASGALAWFSVLKPTFLADVGAGSIDGAALAYTGALVLATTFVFGMVPALHTSGDDMLSGLKGGPHPLRRLGRVDIKRLLLIGQSALATMALVFAGLFLRSLQHAQQINPGFDPSGLAVVSFDMGLLRYDNTRGPEFVRRVNERVRAVPGVVSSAVSSHVVLEGRALESRIRLGDQGDAQALSVNAQAVGLDYFETLGIRLLEGRNFRQADTEPSEFGWAIINQTLARQLWPGRTAIRQRFRISGILVPYEVVGVVADSHYETLGEGPRPYFYIFYDQAPGLKKLTLFVKTIGDPSPLLKTIEREVQAVDPNLPLVNLRTMVDVLTQARWAPRTGSALLLALGAIALLLTAVGTYGVTAFLVGQRWREIGIRIALGASSLDILISVVKWTMLPGMIGLTAGLVATLFGGRLIESLLIGITSHDLVSFAAAAVVLTVAIGAASLWPAVGAMRVDPNRALRQE